MTTLDERIELWRDNVREFAEWCVACKADSIMVTFGEVRMLVHADGRATAVTPAGPLDLTTDDGLRELAAHTELEAEIKRLENGE